MSYEDYKDIDKMLLQIKNIGYDIHDYYEKHNLEDEIDKTSRELLTFVKTEDRKGFMNEIVKVFTKYEVTNRKVPTVLLEAIAESKFKFESVAYAFVTAFMSKRSKN